MVSISNMEFKMEFKIGYEVGCEFSFVVENIFLKVDEGYDVCVKWFVCIGF